jgi:hypothetical protein
MCSTTCLASVRGRHFCLCTNLRCKRFSQNYQGNFNSSSQTAARLRSRGQKSWPSGMTQTTRVQQIRLFRLIFNSKLGRICVPTDHVTSVLPFSTPDPPVGTPAPTLSPNDPWRMHNHLSPNDTWRMHIPPSMEDVYPTIHGGCASHHHPHRGLAQAKKNGAQAKAPSYVEKNLSCCQGQQRGHKTYEARCKAWGFNTCIDIEI